MNLYCVPLVWSWCFASHLPHTVTFPSYCSVWCCTVALFSFLCLILSSSRDTKVSQRTVLTTSGSTNSCGCSWLTGAFGTTVNYSIWQQQGMLCQSVLCYLHCVVFKGTICTLRIIPMPWLLPGNSCPGTEMNRCPWALFSFFISILSFIFWSLQCLSFSNGYLDAVLDNLPHSPHSLSQ